MSSGRQQVKARCKTGVVVRRVAVRVVDLSATGCLLESSVRLNEGAVGTLHLTVEGRRYRETLRISRLASTAGRSGAHRAGAQFLTLGSSRRTLRHLASSAQADALEVSTRPAERPAPRAPRAVLVLEVGHG
jgi:hypothetical protein